MTGGDSFSFFLALCLRKESRPFDQVKKNKKNRERANKKSILQPECSTIEVINFPPLTTVLSCSGTARSTNSPSSSLSGSGKETLIALDLEVMISVAPSRHSFERYTWPESVVSMVTVGVRPRIWMLNDGEDVTLTEDTTESNRIDVLVHPAIMSPQNKKGR